MHDVCADRQLCNGLFDHLGSCQPCLSGSSFGQSPVSKHVLHDLFSCSSNLRNPGIHLALCHCCASVALQQPAIAGSPIPNLDGC